MTKSGKHVQLLYWFILFIYFFCQWKKPFHVYAKWKIKICIFKGQTVNLSMSGLNKYSCLSLLLWKGF